MRKIFLLIALLSFTADRVSKAVVSTLINGGEVVVVPGFLSLRCVENAGGAFSLFSSGNEVFRKLFLLVLPAFVVALVLYYGFVKSAGRLTTAGFALVMGGALGNLTDRIL